MRHRVSTGLLLCAAGLASPLHAQQPSIPIVETSAPDAGTAALFGTVLGVRELAGGRILIDDGTHRQLVVLDAKLANPRVLIDSVPNGGTGYGPRASPIIPYLADSTLFVDGSSLSLVVIDPDGKVARVMAAPKPNDLRLLASSASGVDARGNLVYRGALPSVSVPVPAGAAPMMQWADSAPVVRANFETRAVDTIGKVRVQTIARYNVTRDGEGRVVRRAKVNPVLTPDEWAVLSDGTVAFVRGHDYHVDWLRSDGTMSSSPKLPFDWKPLTDNDKQRLIDSARKVVDSAFASTPPVPAVPGRVAPPPVPMAPPEIDMLPMAAMPDYYPPIRDGAAKADMDGNLWILPNTSARSKAGELVYDVVTQKGGLVHRVRLPAGRSIAGFGRGGVVYLMSGDATRGWSLERVRVAGSGGKPK